MAKYKCVNCGDEIMGEWTNGGEFWLQPCCGAIEVKEE